MIRVAFASNDHQHVNLHFGAADCILLYDVAPGWGDLVAVGHFVRVEMKGENKDKGRETMEHLGAPEGVPVVSSVTAIPADPDQPTPDKVIPKLAFLEGCAAVYAVSIGASSIKRLMAAGIQPIIVEAGHQIEDLLNEVSLAQVYGGLAWVEAAKERLGDTPLPPPESGMHLISSIDELD